MQTERNTHAVALAAIGLFVAALFAGTLTSAFAVTPPHVVLDSQHGDTDACAICHRAHTADAAVPYRAFESTQTTGTSLLIASDPAAGDVSLCLSCHGAARLGSNTDVDSHFLLSSVHGLAPAAAAYGPTPLYCSTCHDSHGDARVASDTPYPKLLRSFEGTRGVYTGEAYCATCHTVKAAADEGERWAGLDVYRLTGHYTGIPAPASGTGIRCSICHDPHGSAVAPLLAASLVPTSVATTFTVTADDRTFCVACHGPAKAAWDGTTTYAASSHGSSSATVAISAKWVPGIGRLVGECQVCHAPMGRSDGLGGAIPKLLDAAGRTLCDRCHAPGGVRASTDTSTEAYPASESSAKELVAVYAPRAETAADGRVSVYGRALSGAAPRSLIGPKQYTPAQGTGPAAAGDVDPYLRGIQLVIASGSAANLSVCATDALTGLSLEPEAAAIPGGFKATSVAVANVVPNGAGVLPDTDEIVVITSDGRLVVYSWTGSALSTVGEVTLPAGPWSLATGALADGGFAKIVVTNAGAGSVTIAGDNGVGGIAATTTSVGVSPVAPSIGRVWSAAPAGDRQIVVGDGGSATATVRVLDASGAELRGYLVISGDGKPTATAVGNVLPTVTGDEVAIAFANASGDSSIAVVPQITSGSGLNLGSIVERATGAGFNTGSLLIGDVEGDGRSEIVAGSGGTWDRATAAVAPSVQVWRANVAGTTLAAPDPAYVAGGAEMAGSAPSLALADFGPVLPSRHPVDEVAPTAHVSTETAGFTRHVTCSDCHDSHVATRAAGAAPAVSGPMAGAWGVTATVTYPGPVVAFTAPARSATGYGVCFKCHSSYAAPLGGRTDLAVSFDPQNASMHAVAGASTSTVAASTFNTTTVDWTSSSVLYCADCHGDDGATAQQAKGPHTSDSSPILARPYLGIAPDSASLLCYDCHLRSVYATGGGDGTGKSGFLADSGNKKLHSMHVASAPAGHGLSCSACHVSHGSVTQPHLLRSDIGFVSTGPDAGTCTNGCHDPLAGGVRSWPTP